MHRTADLEARLVPGDPSHEHHFYQRKQSCRSHTPICISQWSENGARKALVEQTFRGSFPPPDMGGRTRGTPKHVVFGHASANIAQPFSSRFPNSAEAMSDCRRRLKTSCVSAKGASIGELRLLETSVGGVDAEDMTRLGDVFAMELVADIGSRCSDSGDRDKSSLQLMQNSTTGVIPRGDLIIGMLHLGHALSVKT
jgi:hypothetical protein